MNKTLSVIAEAIELTLIPGIGTRTQNRLWSARRECADFGFIRGAESEMLGITDEMRAAIQCRRYRTMAEEILDWGRRENCHFLARDLIGYPEILKEIFDPPLVLYGRGQLEVLEHPAVAIVGTRRPTVYGLQMAEGLAADLAQKDITIISGLARGIDAAAHRGCLGEKGKTIAILGSGIDVIYPPEHRSMARKIIENGLLLTEFTPGTPPAPQNFPVRNRIISGLSLGTVVVEASEYSGSLITARLAMEQNREVYAVPGNLTSPQSFGPNFLIKQGAALVQSWRDIVEELTPDIRHHILLRENMKTSKTPELELLTEDETGVLGLLEPDRAAQFDRLCHSSRLSVPALCDILLNLEMKGRIRQIPGNLYIKTARPSQPSTIGI